MPHSGKKRIRALRGSSSITLATQYFLRQGKLLTDAKTPGYVYVHVSAARKGKCCKAVYVHVSEQRGPCSLIPAVRGCPVVASFDQFVSHPPTLFFAHSVAQKTNAYQPTVCGSHCDHSNHFIITCLCSKVLGASSLALVGSYPLMKRITHWVSVPLKQRKMDHANSEK
eukprot:1150719-Pelagomonas_calceolata.AAC.2